MSSFRTAVSKSYSAEWLRYLLADSRLPALDIFRTVAIIWVVLWHFNPLLFRFGWTGVDLFFILSGFLIGTMILKGLETGSFRFFQYAKSRWLRIYPLYFVCVVTYVVALVATKEANLTTALIVFSSHVVFLQTVLYDIWAISPPYYQVTWSLVVEVFFYVTFPFVLIYLLRQKKVGAGLFFFWMAFLLLRWKLSSMHEPDDVNWQFYWFVRPYYRYDELLFGVGIAHLHALGYRNHRVACTSVGVATLALLYLYIWKLPNAEQYPSMALFGREGVAIPTLLALSYALVVYGLYDACVGSKVTNLIARLAYPMYLTHMLAGQVATSFPVYLAYSLVFAALCSYVFEYPFIRLYKHPKRRQQPIPNLA